MYPGFKKEFLVTGTKDGGLTRITLQSLTRRIYDTYWMQRRPDRIKHGNRKRPLSHHGPGDYQWALRPGRVGCCLHHHFHQPQKNKTTGTNTTPSWSIRMPAITWNQSPIRSWYTWAEGNPHSHRPTRLSRNHPNSRQRPHRPVHGTRCWTICQELKLYRGSKSFSFPAN